MTILNVTPYCISNYGAMLQAWALRRVLEQLGHRVVYLNYPRFWPNHFGFSRLLRSASFSSVRSKLAINRQLDLVRGELGGWSETKPYHSSNSLLANYPEADCYLVGSDQVFSRHFLTNIDTARHALLAFGPDHVRRVAYAASFGCPKWSEREIAEMQWAEPWLRRFTAIGLRETSGVEILRDWVGLEGRWTPDPTLLWNADAYGQQFAMRRINKVRPRVFAYMLGFLNDDCRNGLYRSAVETVARYLGGDVEVCQSKPAQKLSWWLSNIVNADYVITNSFHGICFSILFHRPFLPLGFDGVDSWRNARVLNILQKLGLSNRFVTCLDRGALQGIVSEKIDWNRIDVLRKDFSVIGRSFLETVLKGD